MRTFFRLPCCFEPPKVGHSTVKDFRILIVHAQMRRRGFPSHTTHPWLPRSLPRHYTLDSPRFNIPQQQPEVRVSRVLITAGNGAANGAPISPLVSRNANQARALGGSRFFWLHICRCAWFPSSRFPGRPRKTTSARLRRCSETDPGNRRRDMD